MKPRVRSQAWLRILGANLLIIGAITSLATLAPASALASVVITTPTLPPSSTAQNLVSNVLPQGGIEGTLTPLAGTSGITDATSSPTTTSPLDSPFGYYVIDSSGSSQSVGYAPEGPGTSGSQTSVVGAAANPTGEGYWTVSADGEVVAHNGATFYGDTFSNGITGLGGAHPLNAPIVGIAPTSNGQGYWLVAADGGIFTYGNAQYHGTPYSDGITGLGGAHPLNAPISAIIPTPTGSGYRLIAQDGGVFDFGNAAFYGSTYSDGITGLGGAHPLNAPIIGGEASADGQGYWLIGADGGVFTFGDAIFSGSTYSLGYTGLGGSNPLPGDLTSIMPNPRGPGYYLLTSRGYVFAVGGAPNFANNDVSMGQSTVALVQTVPDAQYLLPVLATPTITSSTAESATLSLNWDIPASAYDWSLGPGAPSGLSVSGGVLTDDVTGDLSATYNVDAIVTEVDSGAKYSLPLTLNYTPTTFPDTSLSFAPGNQFSYSLADQLSSRGSDFTYALIDSATLPDGVTLSSTGVLAGTAPSTAGSWFTAPIGIYYNGYLVGKSAITVTATTLTATATTSGNWGGVADTVSGATDASGTFDVALLDSSQNSTCLSETPDEPHFDQASENSNCVMSEWVGVDGFSNDYLLQAGVSTQLVNVNNTLYQNTYAWYEELDPNSIEETAQPIPTSTFPVAPGNSISINIDKVSPGQWSINLTNNTSQQTYVAPAQDSEGYQPFLASSVSPESVEWISETPMIDMNGNSDFAALPTIAEYGQVTQMGATYATVTNTYAITLDNPNQGGIIIQPNGYDTLSMNGFGFDYNGD